VQAPTDVRAGEVFQARVHLDANLAMRSLAFSIRYDESRLGLVGRSEGVFARQPGVPAELAFDEPSDGNVEVVYRARHGSTASGAGSIAVLEFEALRPGSSAIELRGVRTVDAGGAASARAATTDQRVVVH
jgi:hypothetical protein